MNYSVRKLKENIFELTDKVWEDSLGAEVLQKQIENLEIALSQNDKVFMTLKSELFNPFYHKVFTGLRQSRKAIYDLISQKESRTPIKRMGKPRVHYAISFQILKAIAYCKTYNEDIDWLKGFLKEEGELVQQFRAKHGPSATIVLPFIASDSRWLYKLEEGMQHNLFSLAETHVIKKRTPVYVENKKAFYEMIKPLNEEINEEHKKRLRS